MAENTAVLSTRLLREADEPLYVRLRSLLAERGIDAGRSALATFFPDDTDMEFGILVTADRHVHEFDLHYGAGDFQEQAETATITDWRDRTGWWESTPHRSDIEDACQLLDAE